MQDFSVFPLFIVVPDTGVYNPVFIQIVFELEKHIYIHFVSDIKSFVCPDPENFVEIHPFQILGVV